MLARPRANSLGDLFVLREVFLEETYRDILPLLPKRAVTLLDVGANLGSFCVWLNARHGISQGTCFEPDPSSFRLCRFNLAGNGCAHIKAVPKALGGRPRTITMSVNTARPGGNSIYAPIPNNGESAEIEVMAMSDWLSQNPEPIDVLKLDCEGAEWEILKATPPSAWSRFGLLIAEVHEDPAGERRVEEFPKLLEKLGFATRRWDGHSHGLYLGVRAQ